MYQQNEVSTPSVCLWRPREASSMRTVRYRYFPGLLYNDVCGLILFNRRTSHLQNNQPWEEVSAVTGNAVNVEKAESEVNHGDDDEKAVCSLGFLGPDELFSTTLLTQMLDTRLLAVANHD
jgi:hypothetical protein